MFNEIQLNCDSWKRKFFHKTNRKQTAQGVCFINKWQPNSHEEEDCLGWQRCKTRLHSTHQNGYQSKLWVVHSKGGRCNFWGFLYYVDRRSRWWASRDGPQHSRSRSHSVMISMNLTVMPVWRYFRHSCFVLFCFWTQNSIYYTRVSCVWCLLPYLSLQPY